ncbi:glycosyl hydrolase family 79 C-terminal domain-containing protein [Micromonospora coerulea]|uniref:glycosyl hydrolase family 79 C-terminal domain-containing protein n=1 Tax=Micromonospora coerulea TaxID=47856 RepID=UPI001904DB87|nr:glycosyl hydrolase family 79 C-terminal domain-containing protein [Micromonospora veneta]
MLHRFLVVGALVAGLAPHGGAAAAAGEDAGATTSFPLTTTLSGHNARLTDDFQGFSVESADFAHGFLTEERMSERLRTLGPGVIRLGGYSMDLVWPAFGRWADVPAPPQAIGGTVDQSDLDELKQLLDASGWKVTLGAPLKMIIDPSKIKNPARDPSPEVSLEQVVAEVKAAYDTLGDDLLAVELGNEYDNVTTLTGAEMWDTAKQYQAAIKAAVPRAGLKIVGPSPSGAKSSSRVDEFVTAGLADESVNPQQVLAELSSHWYPWSHCSGRTMTIQQLMSPETHLNTRVKLAGMRAVSARLHDTIPSTINESNSASCSGMPGVSNSYATSLWSLDYLLQAAQSGIDRFQFHTNTAAICGDFKPRDSADYPISYRYYGAFCATDQAALDTNQLSANPLYYGIWAFRQIPTGQFVDLDLPDTALDKIRAYAVMGRAGTLTAVLINIQDPAAADSTHDTVTLNLPSSYGQARAVTLQSAAPEGLASLDPTHITVGGQTITPAGTATGTPQPTTVPVDHRSSTITVAPGTAQIITFTH